MSSIGGSAPAKPPPHPPLAGPPAAGASCRGGFVRRAAVLSDVVAVTTADGGRERRSTTPPRAPPWWAWYWPTYPPSRRAIGREPADRARREPGRPHHRLGFGDEEYLGCDATFVLFGGLSMIAVLLLIDVARGFLADRPSPGVFLLSPRTRTRGRRSCAVAPPGPTPTPC
ncbi:hypothetical protein QJS66_07710 [Kocuria rhizophila]|nr:hypothetical protein QJS66_07710 [Kocuria rhizophila]